MSEMPGLALVTGGSRGIGAATARSLLERGWTVTAPTRAVADFDSLLHVGRYATDFLTQHDRLDALVFCHGQWYSQKRRKPDDYLLQYTQRVVAPLFFMHALLPALRAARGCVVMVASTRAFIGGRENGPYAAACAAQVALMQGLAREEPRARYNAVCPGWTDTDMGKQVSATGGVKPGAVPQPASAVAQAIVGLVEGNETGQVLRVVDGQVARAKWVWE